MEDPVKFNEDNSIKYPKCAPEEADAHAWVLPTKDTLEFYTCKYPPLKANEIKARILYCGLCHTDSMGARDLWYEMARPCCPGHEIIAEVTEVGADCKKRKVGDIIGVGFGRQSCRECRNYHKGHNPLCIPYGIPGINVFGYEFGGYSTRLQIEEDYTVSIPDGMDLAKTAPLLCGGITVYRPLRDTVKAGDKVGVVGIGGLGHMAVQYASSFGCEVTAFTRTAEKTELIKSLGADHVVVVDKEFKSLQAVQNEFKAVVYTPHIASKEIIDAYLGVTDYNGFFIVVGWPDANTPLSMSFGSVIAKQISLVGSLIGNIADHQEMIDFSAKHKIESIIEEYSFEDLPKAFDKLENGKPMFRCVVNIDEYSKKHNL